MNPLIQFKTTTLVPFIAFALAYGSLPSTQALTPPPDGGYPSGNTAEGTGALSSLAPAARGGGFAGIDNTALGYQALFNNTTGDDNTATGFQALFHNTSGGNTADGYQALYNNNQGTFNTAVGYQALRSNANADGVEDTAIGASALSHNTIGIDNTAVGAYALLNNTSGGDFSMGNTAVGAYALENNITGGANTAIGSVALNSVIDHGGNTAVGVSAGNFITGGNNIALGYFAGHQVSTASNVICIGSPGANLDDSCYIGQIYGKEVDANTSLSVVIDATGKLGTLPVSSRRFKRDIKPMDKASEAILGLKPVTFQYKSDSKGTPQFGLIAEEVAEVNSALVVHDQKGEILTVRYDQVNAMLLNEFLKEHLKVEEQEQTIAELKTGMKALAATVKEQAAQIQKVSAQVERSKPVPQMVLNNQ